SGPEVIPLCVWKIEMAASRTRFRYGIYEERRAEQKLVADVLRARVFAEVHYKRAHDGVALLGRFPGQRIDIRHQPVSQFVICDEISLRVGTGGQMFIRIGGALSRRKKNGKDRTKLKPAYVESAICRFVWISQNKPADVCCPVRKSRNRVVEPSRNLPAKGFP